MFVGHVIVRDADSGRNGQADCRLVPDHDDFDSAFMLQQMFDNEYQVILPSSTLLWCRSTFSYQLQLYTTGYILILIF